MAKTRLPVTEAVYQANGKPRLDKPVSFEEGHRCGNCGRDGACAPAAKVLTSRFGSWDDITTGPDGARWLCPACAWVYRATFLRRYSAVVHDDCRIEHPDTAELHKLLSQPLPSSLTVIVPASRKKVVAPAAQWGQVATDTGSVTWTARHYRVLAAGKALVEEYGVGRNALQEAAPPWWLLDGQPVHLHETIRTLWNQFAPARDKTLLPLYLRLLPTSRTPR